jgi:hypothetical protein
MHSITCTKCGLVAFATSASCKRCGTTYAAAGAQEFKQTFGGQSAPGGVRQSAGGAYYSLSGEVTVAGLAAGLVGGLAAGVALSFVYSYLIRIIPFVYLNVFCAIGYTIGVGCVTGCLLKMGKMRNTAVGVFVGVVVAFASYYFSWAIWLSIIASGGEYSVSSFTVARHPLGLWALMQAVNEKGVWSIGLGLRGGLPVNGVTLWVVWGIEALMVLVGAPFATWMTMTMDPFCEACQKWCAEEKDVLSIRPAEAGELTRRFEAKDFVFLKEVGAKREGDAEWLRLDLHRCPDCGRTNTLSVQRERLMVDKKGKATVDSRGLIKQLLLTEADVRNLHLVSSELKQPQPAAA